jgi:DNA-binding NarL/FixJ family response regulator
MDVGTPGGIATTEALRAAPHGAVVALAFHDDPARRERAREAGAAAFVAEHRTEGTLLAAIRGVAPANAERRLHERAPASGKEEQGNAMRDRRGA